jgi:hypothetical protein
MSAFIKKYLEENSADNPNRLDLSGMKHYYLVNIRSDHTPSRAHGVNKLVSLGNEGIAVLAYEMEGGEDEARFLAEYWTGKGKLEEKQTPLHVAAKLGFADAAGFFLDNRAKVNSYDNQNMTPLHLAVTNEHKNVVEVLLKWKADVNVTDKDSKTPLDHANSDEIKALLRKHGGKTGEELKAEQEKK